MTDVDHPAPLILVTGAAGRLGSSVTDLLHAEGRRVLASDCVQRSGVPFRFDEVDLLDHEAVRSLLHRVDVVVQLGNHAGLGRRPPQVVFNENVSMNTNVFQAAAENGARRVVFASTIQLIGSRIDHRTVVSPPAAPTYPLRGDSAPDPSNLYALSKLVSERVLRYYADRCGLTGIALRFPMLHHYEDRVAVSSGEESADDIIEGFTGMTYHDAARLVVATVDADLTGYQQFLPGTAHRHRDLAMAELVRSFYPDLPADLPDLVDLEPVVAHTGWRPTPDPPGAFTQEGPR